MTSIASEIVPIINRIFDFLNTADKDLSFIIPSNIQSDISKAQHVVAGIETLLGAPAAAPFSGRKLMGSA